MTSLSQDTQTVSYVTKGLMTSLSQDTQTVSYVTKGLMTSLSQDTQTVRYVTVLFYIVSMMYEYFKGAISKGHKWSSLRSI